MQFPPCPTPWAAWPAHNANPMPPVYKIALGDTKTKGAEIVHSPRFFPAAPPFFRPQSSPCRAKILLTMPIRRDMGNNAKFFYRQYHVYGDRRLTHRCR